MPCLPGKAHSQLAMGPTAEICRRKGQFGFVLNPAQGKAAPNRSILILPGKAPRGGSKAARPQVMDWPFLANGVDNISFCFLLFLLWEE